MSAKLGEEETRDLLLVSLNAQFEGKAAGEVFNCTGKTDILVREATGTSSSASARSSTREAILSAREESLLRARMSMRDKHFLVCQHMRDFYGSDDEVPSYRTLCRVWTE